MPPQQTLQLVVFMFLFEAGQVGHGVVGQPQPVGQSVSLGSSRGLLIIYIVEMRDIYNDDVHSVVTPGQQEEDDPRNAGEQREPVEGIEPLRRV